MTLCVLFQKSEDFSQYQMKLLLHKNEVSSQINNLKASMKITNSSNFYINDFKYQEINFPITIFIIHPNQHF